jgi:hypothetical protein
MYQPVRFQKLNIPVDVCMVGQDSGLLQQWSDITGALHQGDWGPVGTFSLAHREYIDWITFIGV